MFIRTNFLVIAALATSCSAASTDGVDGVPDVAGSVACYGGVGWSGTPTMHRVAVGTLNSCQDISSDCVSSLWTIAYKGTKCIKFYSSSSCDGSETFEVHANIRVNDHFQEFQDIHDS
ncbi:hypothetical protein BGX20_010413, partial [Mortierella sp. AD010]